MQGVINACLEGAAAIIDRSVAPEGNRVNILAEKNIASNAESNFAAVSVLLRSMDPLQFSDEFYFGQPRVPASYLDDHDAVWSILNKIGGVNRARGEAAETIHHLFMAKLKGYITEKVYLEIRGRYKECIRMLNGLEKPLDRKVPERKRRWQLAEETVVYGAKNESLPRGRPITTAHVS